MGGARPGGGQAIAALQASVPVTTGRDGARAAASRELTNPAYHQHDGNPVLEAVSWLWDRLGELFDRAAVATPGGWTGLTVCLVLVAGLLGALLWRLGRPGPRARYGSHGLFGTERRTAADHRAAAERHAAAGDWSAAVRERMRAVVRALEERALLDERPGRTADEAARAAGYALPGHAEELLAAARCFDDVQYGGRPAAEPDYRMLADLDQRLSRTRPAAQAGAGAEDAATPAAAVGHATWMPPGGAG
jgi:hypothetical protein